VSHEEEQEHRREHDLRLAHAPQVERDQEGDQSAVDGQRRGVGRGRQKAEQGVSGGGDRDGDRQE
jgi:hypothetical protein